MLQRLALTVGLAAPAVVGTACTAPSTTVRTEIRDCTDAVLANALVSAQEVNPQTGIPNPGACPEFRVHYNKVRECTKSGQGRELEPNSPVFQASTTCTLYSVE